MRGEPDKLERWQQRCTNDYAPRRFVMGIPSDVKDLPDILQQRAVKGSIAAYVCDGHACKPPVTDLKELSSLLGLS